MSEGRHTERIEKAMARLESRTEAETEPAEGATPADEAADAQPGDAFRRALQRVPTRDPRPTNGDSHRSAGSAPLAQPGLPPPKLRSPADLGAYRAEGFVSRLFTRASRTAPAPAGDAAPPEARPAPTPAATRPAPPAAPTPSAAPTPPPAPPPAPAPATPPSQAPPAAAPARAPTRVPARAPTRSPARPAPPAATPLGKQPTVRQSKPAALSAPATGASRPFVTKTRIITPGKAGAASPPKVPALKPSRRLPAADPPRRGQATTRREPAAPAPASRPSAAPPAPAPPAPAVTAGDHTNEFESLLEGMLTRRDDGAAPTRRDTPPPGPPPTPSPKVESAFSVDSQIFGGAGGTEANLSDFVSRILDELDAMVDDGPGPPPPAATPAPQADPRPTRPVSAPQSAAADAPADRASNETGEFEDESGPGAAKRLTESDLNALESLFDDDAED